MIDFKALCAPFPVDKISWRVGSTTGDKKRGMALGYIDARDVQDRLDAVCGPENWQNRFSHADAKTICEIGIRINDEWVWKANGAGDTDFEAEKGAISSSFKRAAVMWGVGKYLYDLSAVWVEVEPLGKSYKINDSEYPKLRKLLTGKGDASSNTSEPNNASQDGHDPKSEADQETTAANWCYEAIETVKKMQTLDELEAWRKKFFKTIVKAHTIVPIAQARLLEAIEKRRDDLHPLSA